MNVIDAQAVTRRFGPFIAVDRVDLAVRAGEIVGLVGANGAGKTTLIKMLLGLTMPTSGTIRLFGSPPTRQQRRKIGYVPQNLGLYPDLTVSENLEFRAQVFGRPAASRAARNGNGNGDGGRGDPYRGGEGGGCGGEGGGGRDGDELVGALPLGLQRRVAFTAALQHRPDLLVLDEPTSGVSPLARSRLWDLIRREAERGAAVLASTHYMDEAAQADRLVVLAKGRVVAAGTTSEVIGDRTTLVVDAERWEDAFGLLDRAGYTVILAGRTVRTPVRAGNEAGKEAREIALLLQANGVAAETTIAASTLDETMLELDT